MFSSITHEHLARATSEEIKLRDLGHDMPIRVLDAGCGQGVLTAKLQEVLPLLTGKMVEVYGLDVNDSYVQKSGFISKAEEALSHVAGSEGNQRIHLISSQAMWPFDDGFFDVVLSNQVLEHVRDIDLFIGEIARVMKPDGVSLHLFPLKQCVIEGHLGIPFVHRVQTSTVRRGLIRAWAKLHLPKYGPLQRTPGIPLNDYVNSRSSYIVHETSYRSLRDFERVLRAAGMSVDTSWTLHFYLLRLSRLIKRELVWIFDHRLDVANTLSFPLTSRISSVCLRFVKERQYDPDEPFAGHLA